MIKPNIKYKYRYVYKTTNLINGKIYIGQHSTNKEFENDTYIGSGIDKQSRANYGNNLFSRAVNKYKYENFKCEILEFCFTKKELDIREVFWIKELNSLHPNGYNMVASAGGGYVSKEHYDKLSKRYSGRTLPLEQKEKISKSKSGENNPNWGKKLTDEEKRKVSKGNKGKIRSVKHRNDISNTLKSKYKSGELTCYMKGKKHKTDSINKMRLSKVGKLASLETKLKMSESRKGLIVSATTKSKIKESHRKLNLKTITCPHCGKTGKYSGMLSFHFDNCKQNPNFVAKEKELVTCPYCGKYSTNKSNMTRFHFDNCKLK